MAVRLPPAPVLPMIKRGISFGWTRCCSSKPLLAGPPISQGPGGVLPPGLFLRDVGQAFINASFNQRGKNGEMLLRCHPDVTLVGQLRPTVLNLARVGAY